MIIYLYGNDTFRSRQYLKHSIERFKRERDPQGLNCAVIDGQKTTAEQVWGEITAAPFLAEKRLVVVENLLLNKDKELLATFTKSLKNNTIPERTIVIVWQGEEVSKTKEAQNLQTLLGKEKWAMEFALLTGAKLLVWIKEECSRRGVSIDRPALEYIAQHSGTDMWRLNSLLDQLTAYTNGRSVTTDDVQIFLEEKVDDSIFAMVDALVSGDRARAFRLLTEQRRLGEDDMRLFGMIARQFRILISMRDVADRSEATSSTLAKELGLHPFVVKKSLPVMKRYPLARLKQLHQQLLDIDVKTKTGQADQSLLIDVFVGRL